MNKKVTKYIIIALISILIGFLLSSVNYILAALLPFLTLILGMLFLVPLAFSIREELGKVTLIVLATIGATSLFFNTLYKPKVKVESIYDVIKPDVTNDKVCGFVNNKVKCFTINDLNSELIYLIKNKKSIKVEKIGYYGVFNNLLYSDYKVIEADK